VPGLFRLTDQLFHVRVVLDHNRTPQGETIEALQPLARVGEQGRDFHLEGPIVGRKDSRPCPLQELLVQGVHLVVW